MRGVVVVATIGINPADAGGFTIADVDRFVVLVQISANLVDLAKIQKLLSPIGKGSHAFFQKLARIRQPLEVVELASNLVTVAVHGSQFFPERKILVAFVFLLLLFLLLFRFSSWIRCVREDGAENIQHAAGYQ